MFTNSKKKKKKEEEEEEEEVKTKKVKNQWVAKTTPKWPVGGSVTTHFGYI